MSGRVALAHQSGTGSLLARDIKANLSRFRRTGGARGGLTLVEVILVLSLLVIIGAVTVPLLEGTLTRSRLGHAGDLLRAAWSRARLAATQSGQPYAFRFVPRGSQYEIVPLSQLTDPSSAPLEVEAVENTEEEIDDDVHVSDDSLPSGVTFAGVQVSTSQQLLTAPAVDAAWSTPILFYPDGTTSDAVVTLANEEGMTLRVVLRGLTGTARVGEIGSEVTP